MPDLDFAILADRVSTEAQGVGYVMRGGVDTVTAPQVPFVQWVGLLFRVGFTRAECGRPHRFELIFQDEDGRRLMQAANVLEPVWQEGLPPHWNYNLLGGLNFPLPLPAYGLYSFEILLNDTNHKTLPVRVVAPSEDAAPEAQDAEAG
jgi:hypothetical protein